ncbi:MAG: hypothetical protein ACK5NK_03945 [Niabella sp.]
MKRILNFSVIIILAVIVLASCTRSDYIDDRYTENATVVYHEDSPWIILSFYDGSYAVMKSMDADSYYWPEQGDVVRGDFQNTGTRTFSNVTMRYSFRGWIVSYANNYDDAYADLDYYATRDGYALSPTLQRNKNIQSSPRTGNAKIN